jgi:hypothetical protein
VLNGENKIKISKKITQVNLGKYYKSMMQIIRTRLLNTKQIRKIIRLSPNKSNAEIHD